MELSGFQLISIFHVFWKFLLSLQVYFMIYYTFLLKDMYSHLTNENFELQFLFLCSFCFLQPFIGKIFCQTIVWCICKAISSTDKRSLHIQEKRKKGNIFYPAITCSKSKIGTLEQGVKYD